MAILHLSPSRLLAGFLLLSHGTSAAVLWWMPLPLWLRGAVTLAIAGSLTLHMLRDARLALPTSIVGLRLKPDCTVEVLERRGTWINGRILPGGFCAPYLTIVKFLPEGRRLARHVLVLPDSLHPDAFRQLRVYLRNL